MFPLGNIESEVLKMLASRRRFAQPLYRPPEKILCPRRTFSFFPDKIKLDVRGAFRSGTLPSP